MRIGLDDLVQSGGIDQAFFDKKGLQRLNAQGGFRRKQRMGMVVIMVIMGHDLTVPSGRGTVQWYTSEICRGESLHALKPSRTMKKQARKRSKIVIQL